MMVTAVIVIRLQLQKEKMPLRSSGSPVLAAANRATLIRVEMDTTTSIGEEREPVAKAGERITAGSERGSLSHAGMSRIRSQGLLSARPRRTPLAIPLGLYPLPAGGQGW